MERTIEHHDHTDTETLFGDVWAVTKCNCTLVTKETNMPRIPLELANARIARDQAWSQYYRLVERREMGETITNAEIDEAYNACLIIEDHAKNVYDSWQAVGGTSDIYSITIEADLIDIMRLAEFEDDRNTTKDLLAGLHP